MAAVGADRPRQIPRIAGRRTPQAIPFPYTPGKEPVGEPIHARISAAAKQLHMERDAWLNPVHLEGGEKALKERTLTNLYNAVEEYRRRDVSQAWQSRESAAKQFAPRLADLHAELDAAVLVAYGWSDLDGKLRTDEGDEELLRRLLALNLERASR